MAEPKTTRNDASVEEFLAAVADPRRRADAQALCELMEQVTGQPPVMWGAAIVGFGQYRYEYASGRTGDWPAVAFSPRKQNLVVYLAEGFADDAALLARLGPVTTGKACLYVKRLDGVDTAALRELVSSGFALVHGRTITS
ncbi:DUF1801 domain-containing protein [Catellatospora bangladeshensis]|uniref:YdhG-like domain-containing protein n=1 Tax=Catellatospora bangladeshensis TaxID=310355 RepID=A0A8J3J8Q2_9ACTN|nr:DUF1801 domain-containing protein [Catellatospora bangladeshensis]GIF80267.1 hypothetical protein Cba03nite_16160 [Catellatospora bangladeshensis]